MKLADDNEKSIVLIGVIAARDEFTPPSTQRNGT
jgi:hypothetical protein